MSDFIGDSTTSRDATTDHAPRTNAVHAPLDAGSFAPGFAVCVKYVQAAHIGGLQRDGVIDSAAANAILRAIDTTKTADDASTDVWQVVAALDNRVEAAVPAAIAGASALGRTRSETIATALRMSWRSRSAEVALSALDLRSSLLELAQAHTVTVMGAFADGKAAAPTTLAHFLGGVIGPLETSWIRLFHATKAIDRSPLGAGLLVGEVFGTDREQAAMLLGFESVIENTLDAAGSVEDIVEMLEALAAHSAAIRRFSTELLTWIRTDPTSFFIDERWETSPEPAHPAHAVSVRLEHLRHDAHATELAVRSLVDLFRAQPFGPIGVAWSGLAREVDGVINRTSQVLIDATVAVREALIVNRAYLANRAGRLYSTASDLAAFLMEDQQLNPTAAQRIAGLAVALLKEASLEAAQITPDIIDAAAVMVIGQELKVEMETLGRYIAPRRYIERRDVVGSPKADRTRAWLVNAAMLLQHHREQTNEPLARWKRSLMDLEQLLAESAESER